MYNIRCLPAAKPAHTLLSMAAEAEHLVLGEFSSGRNYSKIVLA